MWAAGSAKRQRDNISCDIILQNISQIKSKYKDDWETIIGNCDSLVYLGGNDYSTFEYISKLLGKQTIRTKGQSIGKGSHGSSSDSYQVTGRELMTPDEVRRMKRSDCLVMISGEAPVRDKKYNLFDHPNLKYTPDYRSPRGLLHRFATPIPAPDGYTMPPDYMAQAGTVSLAYVAELTCPEITEDLYDELQGGISVMKIKKPVSAPETQRKIKRSYLTVATVAAAAIVMALPVYADDPLATINALSDFVFSAIKAIGAILLGFGIVQIGLALKSHDAGQRAQGFMTFFGGVVIYFAKDILDMIL